MVQCARLFQECIVTENLFFKFMFIMSKQRCLNMILDHA